MSDNSATQRVTYQDVKDNLGFNLDDYPNITRYVSTVMEEAEKAVEPVEPKSLERKAKFLPHVMSEMGLSPERERGVCLISRTEILDDEDTEHIDDVLPEGTEMFLMVSTRTGGGNWEDYWDSNEMLVKHENHVYDYDDSFDNTYHYFIFTLPENLVQEYEQLNRDINNDREAIKHYHEQLRKWNVADRLLTWSSSLNWLNKFENILASGKNVVDGNIVHSDKFMTAVSNLSGSFKNYAQSTAILRDVDSLGVDTLFSRLEELVSQANRVAKKDDAEFYFTMEEAKELVAQTEKLRKIFSFYHSLDRTLPRLVEKAFEMASINSALIHIETLNVSWAEPAKKKLTHMNDWEKGRIVEYSETVRKNLETMKNKVDENRALANTSSENLRSTLQGIDELLA